MYVPSRDRRHRPGRKIVTRVPNPFGETVAVRFEQVTDIHDLDKPRGASIDGGTEVSLKNLSLLNASRFPVRIRERRDGEARRRPARAHATRPRRCSDASR